MHNPFILARKRIKVVIMRKPYVLFCILIPVLLLSLQTAAYAGTDAEATVTINDLSEIWFHPDGGPGGPLGDNQIAFEVTGMGDYEIGHTTDDSDQDLVVRWRANFDWWLYIHADSAHPHFTPSGGAYDEKDFSDIQFVNGGLELKDLTDENDPFLLKSGAPGTYPTTGFEESLTFQVKLDLQWDWSGTYTYSWITFTLSDTAL